MLLGDNFFTLRRSRREAEIAAFHASICYKRQYYYDEHIKAQIYAVQSKVLYYTMNFVTS